MRPELRKLLDRGEFVRDQAGTPLVEVSLQYAGSIGALPRDERRKILRARFDEVATVIRDLEVNLDTERISVSGQLVSGLVPAHRFDALCERLKDRCIRVDLVERRKAV